MAKKYWLMFFSCLLLSACSLEKVSKKCNESSFDECYSTFVGNNLTRDYPEERGVLLDNYLFLYSGLTSDVTQMI